MNSSGFISKYYDWASFEIFVKELYEEDGDVTVQRDVTEIDRYGAKRQTDVKITRRCRFHLFTTLVECKRWKDPVSRDRIDVLASSIEALGANNGAIFTTTGFEEGAIAYAKGKGIELFVIRDLTPEEWGLPGRHVSLHLHVNSGEFKDIQLQAQALLLVDKPIGEMSIAIHLSAEMALDPDFDLFSVNTGERGPNLIGILGDAHRLLLKSLSESSEIYDGGADLSCEISARCELDFKGTEFCQLRLPKLVARIEKIGFLFKIHIIQSSINIDRGDELDFAVMVESYVSDQRLVAHRRTGDTNIAFEQRSVENADIDAEEPPLKNGSLLRVCCSPWVGVGESVADKIGSTSQLLKVIVENEGRKPQLSLQVGVMPPR